MTDGIVSSQALDFSGKHARIHKDNWQIGDNDYTFSFFVHFDSLQTWQRIIDWYNGSPNDNIIISQQGNTDKLQVSLFSGGNVVVTALLPQGIRLNQWDHYVITIENDLEVSIWRNGENLSDEIIYASRDQNATFPKLVRNTCKIGASAWDEDKTLDAKLDEFVLFQGKLTDAEIKCLADQCNGNCEECQGDADTCIREKTPFSGRTSCDVKSGAIFDTTDSQSLTLNGAVQQNGVQTQTSLKFDGTGYAEFAQQTFGGDLTFSFWLNPNNFDSTQNFIDFSNGENSDNIIIGQYLSTNDLYIQIFDQSTEILNVQAQYDLESGKWNHYIVTIGANLEVKVYKNLVERRLIQVNKDQNATQIPLVARTQNYVGKSSVSSQSLFQGEIDELLVYNYILNTSEFRCLYDLCDNSDPHCNKCDGDSNTCGGCVFNRQLPSCSCPSTTLELNQPECKPYSDPQTVSQLYCAPPRILYNNGSNDYCICSYDDSSCSQGQNYNFNTCQCE